MTTPDILTFAAEFHKHLEKIAGEPFAAVSLHHNQACPVYLVAHAKVNPVTVIVEVKELETLPERLREERAPKVKLTFPNGSF
jgi:hypothetical protein